MTLWRLYRRWYNDSENLHTHSDVVRVRHFVHQVGREVEADTLTEATIVGYLDGLRVAADRSDTHRNHVVTIRAFLNYGVRSGALSFNPMWRLLLPIWNNRVKRSRPRMMRPESGARPQSLGVGPLHSAEQRELGEIEEELRHEGVSTVRPKQLSECPPDDEPCVWAGCRHHLGVEVVTFERTGAEAVKLNWPGVDVDEMPETCSLRAAKRFASRGLTFPGKTGAAQAVASCAEVSELMNCTQELVRQIEVAALAKLRALEAAGG